MIYIEHIRNAFRVQLRYRLNWGMKLFGTIVSVFLQICLWNALLTKGEGVIDMEYMLGYILVSALLQSLLTGDVIWKVNQQIRSGQIVMNIIKPLNFRKYIFCEFLGNGLFSLISQYFPVTVVFSVIYKVSEVWKGMDFWFLLSLCAGVYLYFSLTYCLALTAFWLGQTWILNRFLNDFITLFSGKMIPVLLFPGFLLRISNCLPFQYMYYTPISLLMNQPTFREKLCSLAIQVGWCILFTVIGIRVEKRGMEKLQVQGG